MELSIDPEFKRWIAALTTEEYVGLRENIKQNGCTQPIDVWNGIIIDGGKENGWTNARNYQDRNKLLDLR